MDAFYAACEELDCPSYKQRPVAIGGMGMICTANYVARRFGVRSAMPGFIGVRLCPELVFVRPNFEKYTAVSARTRDVFRCGGGSGHGYGCSGWCMGCLRAHSKPQRRGGWGNKAHET
jgi:nucleotidyltransferase/DNA polymerase involved in DNA repair